MTIETEFDLASDKYVYGNRLLSYSIDGEGGKCYSDVLAAASMQQSYAIENLSLAYSDVVKMRQRKVSELGEALATLVEAIATIPAKNRTSSSTSGISETSKMYQARDLLAKYGLTLKLNGSGQATYGDLEPCRNDVQTAVDTENNDLQRTMTAMEGLLKKRDNSFSAASKILDKNNTSATTTIKSMGM